MDKIWSFSENVVKELNAYFFVFDSNEILIDFHTPKNTDNSFNFEDAKGKKIESFTPVFIYQNFKKSLNKLISSGKKQKFEYEIIKSPDLTETYEVSISAIENNLFLASIANNTESSKARNQNLTNQTIINSIFNSLEDVIWSAYYPNGEMLFLSPSAERLFGLDYKEMMNDPHYWEKIIHEDDKYIIDIIKKDLETKSEFYYEYRIVCKGETKWIRNKGKVFFEDNKPKRLDGLITDITFRRNVEEESKRSKDFLYHSSRIAKVGGWEYDVIQNKNIWTQVTYEIYEIDDLNYEPKPEEGILFYREGHSRTVIEQVFNEAISNGKPFDVQLEFISAKGTKKWVRSIGIPEMLNGKCVRVSGVIQDITERKNHEDLILQQNKALKEIAFNNSHLIRHPLANILGLINLSSNEEMPETVKSYFNMIEDEMKKLDKIIHDIVRNASKY